MRRSLIMLSLLGSISLPFSLTFSLPVTASELTLTLEEALAEAYFNNPTLQARRAQLRAEDEAVPQAKASWRPNVEIVGDISGIRDRSRTRSGVSDSSRVGYGVDLRITQNVFNGWGTRAAVEGAQSDILASRANLSAVEQSVLLDTVTVYMNLLRDEAVVSLNEQNVDRLVRQLEATRDRFDAGVATLTDVAQAESRVARARADVFAAEGGLEVNRALFEEIVGLVPDSVEPPLLAPDIPAGRDEARAMALENNPSVQQAIFNRRSALHAIDAAEADLLPSVDLLGTASHDWNKSADDSRSRNYQITAQVTVPIYQQGFETSEVREAKLSAGQALIEIEQARRDAAEQAVSAWETYQSVIATIVAIKEETRAAEIALEGVQQEELVGQRTVLDVLDAEQELLDARVSLVGAERDETVALYELLAATGGLTAAKLGLEINLYDPGVHYQATEGRIWGWDGPVEVTEEDRNAMRVEP